MIARNVAATVFASSALAAFSACSAPASNAIPTRWTMLPAGVTEPAKRGKIKIYTDTFGDPVPQGIAVGPDGALWFTDSGNDVIGRMTTRGDFTMQVSPGDEVSDGITAGPDGALWFTTYNHIGRITTGGSVTLFPNAGGTLPHGITTGPDGALWFAESDGNVGRITTEGSITHFPVAPANAALQSIVTGPDGNLWVTQYIVGGSRLSNQVIRLTTGGQSKSFTVGIGPDGLCVGPDGALWFTEAGTGALGRLTVNGKYKEYSIAYRYNQPSGIAAGPDRALWFTDFSGRAGIGRMTVSGKMKFYGAGTHYSELDQIISGPGGAMWFSSSFGPSAIGRIATH